MGHLSLVAVLVALVVDSVISSVRCYISLCGVLVH